jgi:probable addiction module antidote protein
MSEKITPFDVAEHLKTDEDIKLFLKEAAETGNDKNFIHALNTTARAKGMSFVAQQAGVTPASLYKSLSDDGNPRFDTISKIVEALGCKLVVS